MKKFDKSKFNSTNKKLTLAFFGLGIIGITSVICAFACGKGLGGLRPGEFSDDPKDYYGTYYGNNRDVFYKFDIKSDHTVDMVSSIGLPGKPDTVETRNYTYLDADAADKAFTNYEHQGQACLAFWDNEETNKAMVLYIVKDKPYEFAFSIGDGKCNANKKTGDINAVYHNPRDYYGYFECTDPGVRATLDIKIDGTFVFDNNGDVETMKHQYVDASWMHTYAQNSDFGNAIVAYYPSENGKVYYFSYQDGNQLIFNSKYTFRKTKNYEPELPPEEPDTSTSEDIPGGDDPTQPGGGDIETGHDPKDYYGTYYFTDPYTSISVVLQNDGTALLGSTLPIKGLDFEYQEFPYRYVDSSNPYILLGDNTGTLKLDVSSKINHKYEFYIQEFDLYSTTQRQYISDFIDDPANYYGSYGYGSYKITIGNEDVTLYSGTEEVGNFKFAYVLENWFDGIGGIPSEIASDFGSKGLILVDPTAPESGMAVIGIRDYTTIVFAGMQFDRL